MDNSDLEQVVTAATAGDLVAGLRLLMHFRAYMEDAVARRIPAEWEYACRAGTTTAYSFGNTDHGMGDYAWYGGFRGDGNITDDKFAHAVKSKKPNQWGLYDMHGNVWEWCENRHESNASRVVRGGAWNDSPADCRSAYRGWVPSTEGYGHGGFRVVVDISSTQK